MKYTKDRYFQQRICKDAEIVKNDLKNWATLATTYKGDYRLSDTAFEYYEEETGVVLTEKEFTHLVVAEGKRIKLHPVPRS